MSRVERKNAITVGDALKAYLKQYHITPALNDRRVFEAWDEASGAGRYTIKWFFRGGKLYITLNSSVVRSQLSFQRDALIEKINSILEKDILFDSEDGVTGFVKELILK